MKLLFWVIYFITISQLIHIYAQNQIDSENIAVKSLQTKLENVQILNNQLRIQVLTFESYLSIASRAAQLGFIPNNEIFIVK